MQKNSAVYMHRNRKKTVEIIQIGYENVKCRYDVQFIFTPNFIRKSVFTRKKLTHKYTCE